MDAYIPESYIQDAAGRIEAYKRIAAVAAREDADDVLDELRDRYGKVPASVAGLVDISLARVLAAQLGIYEVTQKRDDLILYSDALDLTAVKRLLRGTARRMMVNASAKPYLSVRVEPGEKPLDVLGEALAHLEAAKTISCEEL